MVVLVGAWFAHGRRAVDWRGIIRIAMITTVFDGSKHRCIHGACGLSLAGVRGQTGRQRVEGVESRRSEGESVLEDYGYYWAKRGGDSERIK